MKTSFPASRTAALAGLLALLVPALPAQWAYVPDCHGGPGWGQQVPLLQGESDRIGRPVLVSILYAPPQATVLFLAGPESGRISLGGGRFCLSPILGVAMGTGGSAGLPGSGGATLPLAIPADPSLVGMPVLFQAAVLDTTHTPLLCLSNGLRLSLRDAKATILAEDFATTTMLDTDRSGAAWGGGELKPGLIGGTGVLGDFDPAVGSTQVGGVYVFDTGDALFPAGATLDATAHRVTDGVFHFASFVVAPGMKVRFTGIHPAKVFVRGLVDIQGTVDVDGETPLKSANYNAISGQPGVPGGLGGAGGGRGGDGGDEPGAGTPQGKPGQDMTVPIGHPKRGQELGTGGRGSAETPLALNANLVTLDYYDVASIQHSAPGGGGGAATPGGVGSLFMMSPPNWSLKNPAPYPKHGASVAASNFFPFWPLAAAGRSLAELVLGGAGGGGAGVCPYGTFDKTPGRVNWSHGNGGGGGGGALALRSGGDFRLAATGMILARGAKGGGAGVPGSLSPGGGGAGGAILVQTGGAFASQGVVDVTGGPSRQHLDLYTTCTQSSAAGGDGFFRAEAVPALSPGGLGQVSPPPSARNAGLLVESDHQTGAASRWWDTRSTAPQYLYYRLNAAVAGQPAVYTDDPAAPNPARLDATPVALLLQGARLDAAQQVVPGTLTRWVAEAAHLGDPTRNGGVPVPQVFRWTVIFDRSLAPGQDLKVTRVEVAFY